LAGYLSFILFRDLRRQYSCQIVSLVVFCFANCAKSLVGLAACDGALGRTMVAWLTAPTRAR